jgi:pyruvate dehydrogenase E2 component (dihydrolipoamide acetyltransferase)
MDEVIMPALGMAQDTGKVIRWLKREGEAVSVGEPLLEVETDKAVVEVEANANGVLAHITSLEGDVVPVGRRIAVILQPGEQTLEPETPTPGLAADKPAFTALPAGVKATDGGARVLASPKARRIASERGIDLNQLSDASPGGIVKADDVPSIGAAPTSAGLSTSLWRSMSENVTQSWQSIPHIFLGRDVDASALVAGYAPHKTAIPDLTLTDLILKAVATALVHHPVMNSQNSAVNLGVAVALDDGLIVPVIAGADRLSLADLAERRRILVERARSRRLKAADLANPTFTVSNLGMYGIGFFTAIVSEGQAGILAVGAVQDRVVPVDGRVTIRPVVTLVLSCDHRMVDGARGARFLETLSGLIEQARGEA